MKKPRYKSVLSPNVTSHIIIFQWLALWAMGLGLLMACSAPRASSPSAYSATATIEPKESGRWRIEFSMSGGFAGLQRSVELFSTGQMTVTDQKTNRQVTVQVPETEMEKIFSWVMHAQPAQPAIRLSDCRDCFEYEMNIHRDEAVLSFWFNDVTLENAELAPLINTLAHMQEEALSGQLTPR